VACWVLLFSLVGKHWEVKSLTAKGDGLRLRLLFSESLVITYFGFIAL